MGHNVTLIMQITINSSQQKFKCTYPLAQYITAKDALQINEKKNNKLGQGHK